MNLNIIRDQLRSGELNALRPRPFNRLANPFTIFKDDVCSAVLANDITAASVVNGKLVFAGEERQIYMITLDLPLEVGRAIGTCWGQGAVRLDIHMPPQRIIAQALTYKPTWVPGIEGKTEPSPADGPCYQITAEVLRIKSVDVNCVCWPPLEAEPLKAHKSWCPTRKLNTV